MNKRIVASLLTAAVVFAQSPLSYVKAADDISDTSESGQSLGEELLPAGIPGLPEDYVLPESEMDEKKEMMEHDVLDALGFMTADEDYCSDLVYTYAETEEEAIAYAEAFNGTLTVYSEKIATIKLPSDVSVLQAVSASSDPACTKLPSVSPVYISYLDPGEKDDSGDLLDSVGDSSDPSVLSYKDHIAKGYADDPFLQNPEELYNDNDKQFQWQHDMVNTWEAWTYGYGNPDIKVGVLDTGVLAEHEDLKDNVKAQYDFCSHDNSDKSYVVNPHGTHVAGIIGASINNGKGGAGIAPGVSLYGYNVFTMNNGAFADDQARAVRDCADKGIDIINLSIGGMNFDVEYQKSINYAWEKGVTIFVSMGNDYTSHRHYPAGYENVLTVSNLSRDGLRSYSSTYGPWCDLAAPGTNIISPVCVFNGSTLTTTTNAYDSYTGTSMSTPVAAGVAALYMSRYGNPGPKQMEKLLKKYSHKCDSEGCGVLVDAGELMAGGGTPEPVISLYTEYGYFKVDDTKYDYDDVTGFSLSDPLKSTGPLSRTLVYTLDGDDPTPEDHVPYSGEVSLLSSGFASGSEVTIKAAILDETGEIGDVLSLDVELPDDYVIESENKVKKANIILNGDTSKKPVTKYTMSFSGDSDKDCVSFNALLYTASSNQLISLNDVEHEWSTSDPSTLLIEEKEDGILYVYPVNDGKAKIKLKLLDGSRKTAVCNINIKKLVTGISISGQDSIAPGKSDTYKVSVLPTDAKNKKVEWSVTDISGKTGATISSGGKVKVPSNASVDTSFRITAKALDGSGVTATKDVYVKAVTKKLSVNITDADFTTKNSDSQAGIKKISFNPKTKMLKNIVLSSADISSNSYYDDRTNLEADTDNAIPVEWKTSNSNIVKVNGKETDYNSKVTLTGLKSGKAVITCKTNDGSEKSVKINVTVINPVSYVSLNMDQDNPIYAIAKGYSMKNPVVLGEGYGKPGIRKVSWDYSIYLYNRVIDSSSGNTWNKTYSAELTQEIKKSNLVSLSDSGLLKVSKDWKDGIYRISNNSADGKGNYHAEVKNAYTIRVTATATDGTGFSGYKDYVVTPPIKSVECAVMDKGTPVILPGRTLSFYVVPKDEDGNRLYMEAYNLEIINTNPKCGGVTKTSTDIFGGFNMNVPKSDVYKRVSNGTVGYYYYCGFNSVKINFNDGSGKSVRYRIMRNVQ